MTFWGHLESSRPCCLILYLTCVTLQVGAECVPCHVVVLCHGARLLRLLRRLYALERMVQVLHFNMHRIYDLWGIFLSHVLEVLASAKAALRTAAMDAVGKAITGALDRPVPARK